MAERNLKPPHALATRHVARASAVYVCVPGREWLPLRCADAIFASCWRRTGKETSLLSVRGFLCCMMHYSTATVTL